jgi:hypothetical protein
MVSVSLACIPILSPKPPVGLGLGLVMGLVIVMGLRLVIGVVMG